jgi:hypothetical protein
LGAADDPGAEESEGVDEAGILEAQDVAGHESVVVSDSRSVSKSGYGWNPEVVPHVSHRQ